MPIPVNVSRFERSLAREEVYNTLQSWIVDGTLKAEEVLRDQELASSLGVSRTPVREALRRLEDEGLIETALNRWTRVASLDLGEAQRIYPIIWTLEPLALRLAEGKLGTRELARMDMVNQELKAALQSGDLGRAAKSDTDFHQVYIACSGNSELIKMLGVLKTKIRRLETFYFANSNLGEQSVVEHEAILKALRMHEYEEAGRAIEANWQASLQRLLAHEK